MTKVKVAAPDCGDKRGMPMLRALLCLVTVLSLALSGVALAAQTVHGPVTEMVICGDGGAETIRLDAQGNPVESSQCCDCLQCLTLGDAPPVEPISSADFVRLASDASPAAVVGYLPLSARYSCPMPRGPPAKTETACDMEPQPRLSPAALEFGQGPRGVAVATDGQPVWVTR